MLIGLTGGIGAGKSTVSDYLKAKGYTVLDADEVAREIVEPGTETLLLLTNTFGIDILDKEGGLNRKKLAEIVFSNPASKKRLDEIMHGKVIEILLERAESKSREALIFVDVPLLFESGMDRFVDQVWLVDADEEVRIQRVTERDKISRRDVLKRIRYQMGDEEKKRRSHVILDNSEEIDKLYMQLDKVLKEIESEMISE